MDPYTEKLIERTRQRREMLNQKLGKTPDPAPRKRRTPLGEDLSDNVSPDNSQQNDDSPKRQCLRESEQDVKQDTPAISSVRSRMQNLSKVRGDWSDTCDSPVPAPRKSLGNDLDEENTPAPVATPGNRRGRLAALAANINTWEDDLSRPTIQKEEEKKPRWQPPKSDNKTSVPAPPPPPGAQNSPKKYRAPQPPTASSAPPNRAPQTYKSPQKQPTASIPKSPVKSMLSIGSLSNSNMSKTSPVKKVFSPLTSQIRIPQKVHDDRRLTDQIPVNVKGLDDSPSASEQTDDEPTAKPVSERFNSWAKKEVCGTPKSSRALDPALTPVAARMASWEQKVSQTPVGTSSVSKVNQTPRQTCTPARTQNAPARPISTPSMAAVMTQSNVLTQVTPKPQRPVSMAVPAGAADPTTRPVSERMAKWQEQTKAPPVEEEPTAYSVNARMSAWEHMSSSNQVSYIKKVNPGDPSPTKSPARPPPPTNSATKKGMTPSKCVADAINEKAQRIVHNSPKSATPAKGCPLSPSSASGTMKSVHQRLMEQTHNSNKSQDIMEKMRQERMAELNTIQNRWKNGILRDDAPAASEQPPSQQTSAPVSTPSADKTDKREAIRAKARADFDNKLAAMGFDVSDDGKQGASFNFKRGANSRSYNQHMSEQQDSESPLPPAGCIPVPPPPPPTEGSMKPPTGRAPSNPAASKPPTQGGSSIYKIISQKGNQDVNRQPSHTAPPSNPVQRQASTNSRRVQFDDSFDSTTDESEAVRTSMDEEDETESHFETESDRDDTSEYDEVEMRRKPHQQVRPRHPVYEEDDVSLSAFVPDSVRRQSVLPSGPEDRRQSFTSETSQDSFEEPRNAPRNPYRSTSNLRQLANQQDSSSSLASSADSNRGDIDDLLDEAMDSEEEESRRKGPVPFPRNHRYHSETSDSDGSLVYSVSAYRSKRNLQMPPVPSARISRHSEYVDTGVEEEEIEMPRQPPAHEQRKSVQERIQELQELVQQEQSVIMQTSNALNQCCGRDSYFAGSAEQVECNRLLLVACQKRQSYILEIQRLKSEGTLESCGRGPKGSLTISDIRLPLKKEFVTKIGTSQDNITYFFIILIRKETQVICTQMLSTHDPMMRGSLDFPNLIKINGITGDFKLTLEIYGMSVSREAITKDKKKPKTPKKSKHNNMPLQSPGGPMAVRTTSFSLITTVPINMRSLDKTCFNLERLPYLSPLHGSIYLRLKCLMEANVEERGFLTMFEDVSGLGAWHRRWVALARNKLCFWKYPDDENRKDPIGVFDLKRCITEKVGLIPRDICARPNTFELMTVRQPRQGEKDTLVSRTYNTMTTVRVMLSADTKEERIVWCNKINRNLANIRTWHSDALPPVKVPPKAI